MKERGDELAESVIEKLKMVDAKACDRERQCGICEFYRRCV